MCTTTQGLQWKKITPQNEFSPWLTKNKGAAQGTAFQRMKIRNYFCSDQNGTEIVEEAYSVQY